MLLRENTDGMKYELQSCGELFSTDLEKKQSRDVSIRDQKALNLAREATTNQQANDGFFDGF